MNLEQYELINRRAREQAQARNHEMLREIRRRRDEQQERDRRTHQEHHGHGGSILLLLVLLCGLSRRLRRALLMVVAIVAVVAVVAGMVAGIGGSADVQSFAVTTGIFAMFGAGIWITSSGLAWLGRIVAADLRDELGELRRDRS